ncbi:RcnB family protein [Azospirillum picis]|uniref:Ni/Co efflux regulator RcnB n=1 Tax=Azospirillum picis TaxID=488438 RepID=A0ABU0MFL6_9PROT|nr:RcnB family protein [Azospirillum picis]MBP2298745.1 Ni/Co efflux regulator RcnB [Azospirillum picis]MDQ0532206.1 Ni/Co efflux regulator RcnB [Azospirillum picis]
MRQPLLALAAAIIAVTAVVGSPAMAQHWHSGRDDHRGPDREWNDHGARGRGPDLPAAVRRPAPPPGPPAAHGWHAGDRLAPKWRDTRYVIARPVTFHLHRPPPGHRWVRVGHDALLVASTSGLVVEIRPGLFR